MKEPAEKRLKLAEGVADNDQEEDEDAQQQEDKNKVGNLLKPLSERSINICNKFQNQGELHQHVKEAKDHTTQAMDAATQVCNFHFFLFFFYNRSSQATNIALQ
jgi:hypothetical protein